MDRDHPARALTPFRVEATRHTRHDTAASRVIRRGGTPRPRAGVTGTKIRWIWQEVVVARPSLCLSTQWTERLRARLPDEVSDR
jgi:hypothetical protein